LMSVHWTGMADAVQVVRRLQIKFACSPYFICAISSVINSK